MSYKDSKRSSGTSTSRPNLKFHATPVQDAKSDRQTKSSESGNSPLSMKSTTRAGKKSSQSLKPPRDTPDNRTTDSIDRELPKNVSPVKTFTVYTGLTLDEPSLLLSSEFLPLYDQSGVSKVGKNLLLKEAANTINAKTAISLLSDSDDVKDAIKVNKDKLLDFASKEISNIDQLMKAISSALGALDVTTFSIDAAKNKVFSTETLESFQQILKKGGYSNENISKFIETKMWYQSLIELKRVLITNTPDLVSQVYTRQGIDNDDDSFLISDVESTPADLKRFWVNYLYDSLPTLGNLTNFGTIESNAGKLIQFSSQQYVSLPSANSPTRKSTENSKGAKSSSKSQGMQSSKPYASNVLGPFEGTGRDISILGNILFKEALYSIYFLDKENSNLLSRRFGYTVSTENDNFEAWDYIVGKFPKSCLKVEANPIGLGNSLASYAASTVAVGNTNYNVLTFENNVIPNTDVTPGTFYYVDSSVSTTDGRNFDLGRLDTLIAKTATAYDTTTQILDMLGYEIKPVDPEAEGTNEKYLKKKMPNAFSLSGMVGKLSIVTRVYQSLLETQDSSIVGFKNLGGGFDFSGLVVSSEDLINTRLAATIMKAAVSPVESYKDKSQKLRALLFMWIMNIVLNQVDGVGNSITINYLMQSLSETLGKTSSITGNATKEVIAKAVKEGRTFPIGVTDASAPLGQPLDIDESIEQAVAGTEAADLINQIEEASAARIAELTAERKAAVDAYKNAVSASLFQIDQGKGLWKVVIDLMKEMYSNDNIYVGGNTGYSNMPSVGFMYVYFDLILRIVSSQTPENLLGTYRRTFTQDLPNQDEQAILDALVKNAKEVAAQANLNVIIPDIELKKDTVDICETGFYIDRPSPAQLNKIFYGSRMNIKSSPKTAVRRLVDAIVFLESENELVVSEVAIFRKFFSNINSNLTSLRNFLDKNFEKHLTDLNRLYQADNELSQQQKNALINMSLSEEQLKMTKYVLSEYTDAINQKDTSAKLKTIPSFASFPDGFSTFLSANETDHISCHMLSPFFKNVDFMKLKGSNKKIISVGIPPKLVRSLTTSVRLSNINSVGLRQGFVKVKVWKLDRLHPDVVYLPKSYLFEVNRFPTRILGNWSYDAFYDSNETNLLKIPTKVLYPNGKVALDRDYTAAFSDSDYGDGISEDEATEVYANHAMSFLLEEYLRWFTDARLDETRYYNYTPLSPDIKSVESQFNKFLSIASATAAKTGQAQTPPPSPAKPSTGFKTTSKNQKKDVLATVASLSLSKKLSPVVDNKKSPPKEKFVIPMDDTVRAFFQHETFMSDLNEFQRRALYPKKFDRVFNILIDPDDFNVDQSLTSTESLKSLIELGIIRSFGKDSKFESFQGNGNLVNYRTYKNRDTTQEDVWMDEYFVTVEPYDYVQEYED